MVQMPHFSDIIPSTNFYGFIFSEPVGVARWYLIIIYFIPRASNLFTRMTRESENSNYSYQQ